MNNGSTIAFDLKSARTYDADGRLHVSVSNISKANVCEYFGQEIPDYEQLGLDAKVLYKLLRDPKELEKGAATSNGIQLLSMHIAVSSDEPQKEVIAGTTGTDAAFNAPYLQNSLVVWDKDDIKNIENGSVKELSCGYRYVPDMTPGTYEGERYDGVMREIIFNHVALVKQGRAGSDVVVGDSTPLITENENMSTANKKPLSKKAVMVKGAVLAHLGQTMAADKMPNIESMLRGIKTNKWQDQKKEIGAAIKPKLAKDADLDSLITLLDKLDGDMPPDDEIGEDDDPGMEDMDGMDDDPNAGLLEKLIAAIKSCMSPAKAADEPAQTSGAANADPKDQENKESVGGSKKDDKDDGKMDKGAMDAAIKLACDETEKNTIARLNGITEAREAVRPIVGNISIACDSAEAVYKAALEIKGIDTKGVHPSAFKSMVSMLPKAGEQRKEVIAQDSARGPLSPEILEAFPHSGRVSH